MHPGFTAGDCPQLMGTCRFFQSVHIMAMAQSIRRIMYKGLANKEAYEFFLKEANK